MPIVDWKAFVAIIFSASSRANGAVGFFYILNATVQKLCRRGVDDREPHPHETSTIKCFPCEIGLETWFGTGWRCSSQKCDPTSAGGRVACRFFWDRARDGRFLMLQGAPPERLRTLNVMANLTAACVPVVAIDSCTR